MPKRDHPNSNPINTGTRRLTLVGLSGATEELVRVTNGGLDVNIQDQFTPVIIAKLHQNTNTTTTDGALSIDDKIVSVVDATGMVVGHTFVIFNASVNRFYTGEIVAINVNDITVDSPLDFAYPSGSEVESGSNNMAVNGSVTAQTFGLRTETPNPIVAKADITRIILVCETVAANDLSTFGDIAGGITNGIVLRKISPSFVGNIFNAKTNADFANVSFNFEIHAAANPIQGQDGFVMRLTFAGPNRMGVTIRLNPNEDLQFIITDDLSSLTSLTAVAEGHIVE